MVLGRLESRKRERHRGYGRHDMEDTELGDIHVCVYVCVRKVVIPESSLYRRISFDRD